MTDHDQAAQAAADDAFTAAMTAAGYGSNGIMLRALSAAIAAARPHLEAAERAKWTRIEPDPDQPGYNRGVFDIPALVAEAVAAERERCAALAAGQAEDYERSFGVADGPETLGRLEAAHDALVSLAALLREGQAPGA